MAEYYNVETRERRYSYNKPAGHGWVRADQLQREGWDDVSNKKDDDDGGDSGLGLAVAAVEVGAALAGLFDSGSGDGGSEFAGGGGDFGGGGASGDF